MIQKLSARERETLDLIMSDESVTVASLSKSLAVSPVTVRTTLNSLAEKGVIVRTWGGAAPAFHPDIIERQKQCTAEKTRIARAAAELIQDGDTVMIEAGTTTAEIARFLLGRRDVKIVSNSALVVPYARANPGIVLTQIGGEFRPETESFVGPSALEQLRRFHVRLAFVGTDGFSAQAGLTTHLVEGAEIVKSMAALADTTVVVADSSKYAKHGFVNVLQLNEVDILISDEGIEATKRAEITDLGVDLRLV